MLENPTIRIENVVATSTIGAELNLNAIALALEGAEYEPEQFPGIVYRIKDPKTATLIFRSGKIVCTGAKSDAAVKKAINIVVANLADAGFEVTKDPEVRVENMVATIDLETKLNLTTIALSLGMENVEYEPEQFPGLVYRIDEPKVVALLFASGKVVCTGAKTKEDIVRAVKRIQTELSNAGLL
ncbi:MAG: TATA-box-binding protein [Thermoplasmata archaeon]|nr:TATA-box-binding protein [Thermoplasmata archaeon]